jgi:hypothetical protein
MDSYYYNNNGLHKKYKIGCSIDININYNTNYDANSCLGEKKLIPQDQIKKKKPNSFENFVLREISKCEYQVFTKTKIASEYAITKNHIKYMVLGTNFIVTIQSKWVDNSIPSPNEILNFIESTKHIGKLENKFYLGIFLSKLPISPNALLNLDQENLFPPNRFVSINSTSDTHILSELKKILYDYRIWYYDSDGCVEMLN